jgi:acetolactate synthase-1/2/3 large subunit
MVNKIRVSDYIAQKLVEKNIKYVYGLMGGGAAGLNDAFIKNEQIKYICFHHEQGAGNAAIGQSKVTNYLSVVNPTTGCGGTNCITSVLDAWQDSHPILFISGNVKKSQTSLFINKEKQIKLRKYGIQEHNIISTVNSITKYSKMIENALDVPYELDYAIDQALSPRMGPVWLDIPSDIQHAQIDIEQCKKFIPNNNLSVDKNKNFSKLLPLLNKYNKPLFLIGHGIKLSKSDLLFKKIIEKYQIPFVTSYLAIDIVNHNHPLNIGTIGIKGSRSGNFAIQNADLLIILGCSLNCSHTGYDEKIFSPNSYKVMVDIDSNEYAKGIVKIDEYIQAELFNFLNYDES